MSRRTPRVSPTFALLAVLIASAGITALTGEPAAKTAAAAKPATADPIGKVVKSDAEWRKQLSGEQYRVLRGHGTEIAFTGAYWNEHRAGTYVCAACGLELFRSKEKFDSGTGWPSFWAPIERRRIAGMTDTSFGEMRTEVNCARCGGHLGHVFDDGPPPTGLRYCINSVSLKFVPEKGTAASTKPAAAKSGATTK
jgi:peptide-methionine (R)-S-oxide reductase